MRTLAALGTFCGDHGPRIIFCTAISGDPFPTALAPSKPSKTCIACTADQPLLRSEISNNHVAVSGNFQDFPVSEDVVRRLLSAVAVTFYIEAPDSRVSLCTDGTTGIVFSQKFAIKDHKEVRGFNRKICILVYSEDKAVLERYFHLVSHLTDAIRDQLVELAEKNFDHGYRAVVDARRNIALREKPRSLNELTHPNIYSLIHVRFCQLLWQLQWGFRKRNICGPPFIKTTKDILPLVLNLKDVARAANRSEFCQLLCNLAYGVPFAVTSSCETLLKNFLNCIVCVVPRKRYFTWKAYYEKDLYHGFVRGLLPWADGDEQNLSKRTWFETNVLGHEEVVLHGHNPDVLEGLTFMSEYRNSTVPNLVRNVTHLAYAEVDPAVVHTSVDAHVERYASWAKAWLMAKLYEGPINTANLMKRLNLRKCEEPILKFWGTEACGDYLQVVKAAKNEL